MKFPMACGWTARAESGVGAFVVPGGLLTARSTGETRQAVGICSLVLGVPVILFPTVITGLSFLAGHLCRQLTLPAFGKPGITVILIGGYLFRKHE